MLSIYEFNQLALDQKGQYVWQHCTYLAHRVENTTIWVNLYHAGKFTIEVWYNREGNEIEKIQSFNSVRLLEPYLPFIDISSLFK